MTYRLSLLLGLMVLLVAACGSFAEPPPNAATLEAEALLQDDDAPDAVAVIPTNTPLPPTETPLPPTDTPPPPTEPPTEEPIEAEEEPADDAPALTAEEENIIFFIQEFSNPSNGQQLFNRTFEVEMAGDVIGEWACVTCHVVDNDEAGVGPGVYSLALRAGDRVPGQPAELYIYESIILPNAYIVEGYSANVMPIGYADVFTEQELYDISAYLMTLTGDE
ncbi:MAG: hypothetical protein EA396_06860 [Anaerolineaceae bacterium]|nr:MAG: hypothetical protein EA396_06860 [Anaerolineaceae bacterium]